MKTSIKQFLDDLYEIDPSLRDHQAALVPMIEKLLASDPAQSPDADFVARLRRQLQTRSSELSSSSSPFSMNKFLYALGGALSMAVIIPLVFVAVNQQNNVTETGAPMFTYGIQDVKNNAFGDLAATGESSIAAQPPMRNQSGGGGPEAMMQTNPAVLGTDAAISSKMIMPYPMTQYDYVYDGTLKDLSPTVSVFKRDTKAMSIAFSKISSSLNLGTIDLGSFAGMNVDSISMSQNKPFGYQITVNLRDSSIYLDAQWDQWPQSKCQTDACWQAERVKIGDVPSNDALTQIAQSFVKEHSIDVSHYGAPVVETAWKQEYDRAQSPDQAYIPDTIRVIYPLMIDGKEVLDQSGQKTGIAVGVNIKHKRVMNVYGIMDRTYQKSSYEGVTDEQKIKDYIATQDNYFGGYPIDMMMRAEGAEGMPTPVMPPDLEKTPISTIVLGEPTLSYVQYFRYANNVNEELFVPSLVFPVKEVKGMDSASYYRSSVIVPLSKDILENQNGGGVRPMGGDVRAM